LYRPNSGRILLDGKDLIRTPAYRIVRLGIARTFQNVVLFQNMTVLENLLVGAHSQMRPFSERRGRKQALEVLEYLQLGALGDRLPGGLPFGTLKRVELARALVAEPRLLLLDEPFSLLDALTRMELQDELITLWERTRRTVIMVTHDVDEALFLADRVVMVTNGPAATIGQIFDVPFPRPRRREELLDRPDYFWLRDAVLGFLEAQSHAGAM